jgi:EAL domain-containing protein (putative c-di-GMP-specific phosphodiesterase class I)
MFSDDMEKGAQMRFELIEDLRDVSFESGLRLVYQPVVRLDDRSVAGVEALVRWQHPTRGLLAPGAFIELAEQTNTIHALGAWVIETAFAQLADWQRSGKVPGAAFRMAVNLSVRQLQDRALTKHVQAAIDRHKIEPSCIVFELTESVYADRNDMLSRMMELRDIGVKLAIDDFGTGYSSLAYIRELPVDELKIDRSFVQGLGVDQRDGAVVKAILGMAEAIGLGVIAEGVETKMQVDALEALGCERAQGFYFGRGVPADELSFTSARSHNGSVGPMETRSALPY